MSQLNQLPSLPLRQLASLVLGSVAAVIGATATAFTTTGTPVLIRDGEVVGALTAQTNTALAPLVASDFSGYTVNGDLSQFLQPAGLAGFYTQPAGTTVYYVIGITPAGTWKVVQGTFDGQQVGTSQGITVLGRSIIPDIPPGFVPVAVMKVVSGGAVYTPGTTALTGIATFRNVAGQLPIYRTF